MFGVQRSSWAVNNEQKIERSQSPIINRKLDGPTTDETSVFCVTPMFSKVEVQCHYLTTAPHQKSDKG